MTPKILSWNVRGLNEGNKRLRVRNLLHDWKVDSVCFQETKLQCLSWNLVRSLWQCTNVNWVCLDSCGVSGGIMILWDKRVVEKIENCTGVHSLTIKFKNIEDGSIWTFARVYCPNHANDRRFMWEELAVIMSWWNVTWCIGGDFNVTYFPSERSGEACRSAMANFSEFLHEQGLLDLPLVGGSFTWSLSQDPPKRSKIDHFLISHEWEVRYPGVSQTRLPCFCSDHFPLLLDCMNG
jgi:endonuclease/exonuclease/phosphatase family metal-dependent hydrolase